MAGEAAGSNGECIRNVRRGSVHRAFHADDDPARAEADPFVARECEPEGERAERSGDQEDDRHAGDAQEEDDLARPVAAERAHLQDSRRHRSGDEQEGRQEMQEEQRFRHRLRGYGPGQTAATIGVVDVRERHLRLLTETIEAVNSTLDLEEVLSLVARKVADALGADAWFVYLYDERSVVIDAVAVLVAA